MYAQVEYTYMLKHHFGGSVLFPLHLTKILIHVHVSVFHQSRHLDPSYAKGDFVFQNPNIIEMTTKLHAVIKENLKTTLPINIAKE